MVYNRYASTYINVSFQLSGNNNVSYLIEQRTLLPQEGWIRGVAAPRGKWTAAVVAVSRQRTKVDDVAVHLICTWMANGKINCTFTAYNATTTIATTIVTAEQQQQQQQYAKQQQHL